MNPEQKASHPPEEQSEPPNDDPALLSEARAALASAKYHQAFHAAVLACKQAPLTIKPWGVLIRIVSKQLVANPLKSLAFLSRKLLGNRLYHTLLTAAIRRKIPYARKFYWNVRATDLDERWRHETSDYSLVEKLLRELKPARILDIGCGRGRLFPVYDKLRIPEVVGQDIARQALKIAHNRYHFSNITITRTPVVALDFPSRYFDLVICNRVLQHIPPDEIKPVIQKLTTLGKDIYVNEMTTTDYAPESFYLFLHDYRALFALYDFAPVQSGRLGPKTWFVFTKTA